MAETVVNLGIEQAYAQLKAELAKNKCRVINEEPPNTVSVVQGSLWGTSSKTAQKRITFSLRQEAAVARISQRSALTSGYVNLTIIGCLFSVGLMFILGWIALDLQALISVGTQGFWSSILQFSANADPTKVSLFIRLSWILTTFLAITLVVEAIIITRVRAQLGTFAEEILHLLPKG